jgi:hypothetical protein
MAPPPTPDLNSGIAGQTMVDGGCPVIRTGSPCPDRPLPAHIVITFGVDHTVAALDSDSNGWFRVTLPPGDYTLRATNHTGAPLPAAAPMNVSVTSGQYTTVTVNFDSGIR